MKNYELLRQRLNELLPDRVEPEFGCEITFKAKGGDVEEVPATLVTKNAAGNWMCTVDIFSSVTSTIKESRFVKILGQPVSIADILRGIEKTHNDCFLIESDGVILHPSTESGVLAKINLSLPLSHPDNDAAMGAIYQLLK